MMVVGGNFTSETAIVLYQMRSKIDMYLMVKRGV